MCGSNKGDLIFVGYFSIAMIKHHSKASYGRVYLGSWFQSFRVNDGGNSMEQVADCRAGSYVFIS